MNKLLTIKLSPAQFEALRQLEHATGKNKSELTRYAFEIVGRMNGVKFPQDVIRRGEYERPKK